ncbi:MAG: 4Fe-4S dicluster domain-containing protein [Thermoplasmata archaeon]
MTRDYEKIEEEIKEQAKEWLENDDVNYLIGYEKGSDPLIARPVFIRTPEDADRLVWNQGCVNNLTRFLVENIRKEKDTTIGIVVKPCDSKAIVELIKENVLPRERMKIIGVTCEGMIDKDKEEDDTLADKCQVCTTHNPVIADVVFGPEVEEDFTDEYQDIQDIEEMDVEERWEYWEDQLSKCIRCYACRDVCPMCYCEECVFEREKPHRWLDKSVTKEDNFFYHMIRALHLAGRCIDCGECERVCPMDIPIRKMNRILEKCVKKRFDLKPGMDVDDKSLFGSYDKDDPEEVIV